MKNQYKKGITSLVVIFLIILGIGIIGGGYVFYQDKQEQEKIAQDSKNQLENTENDSDSTAVSSKSELPEFIKDTVFLDKISKLGDFTPGYFTARWLMPNHTALINASIYPEGAEGDAQLYIVDFDKNSSSLLGNEYAGLVIVGVDRELGVIVRLNNTYYMRSEPVTNIIFYDFEGNVLSRNVLKRDKVHRSPLDYRLNIVSGHEVIYLRNSGTPSTTDVVLFDSNTGTEKVLYSAGDEWGSPLSVSKDKKSWTLSGRNEVITKDF